MNGIHEVKSSILSVSTKTKTTPKGVVFVLVKRIIRWLQIMILLCHKYMEWIENTCFSYFHKKADEQLYLSAEDAFFCVCCLSFQIMRPLFRENITDKFLYSKVHIIKAWFVYISCKTEFIIRMS